MSAVVVKNTRAQALCEYSVLGCGPFIPVCVKADVRLNSAGEPRRLSLNQLGQMRIPMSYEEGQVHRDLGPCNGNEIPIFVLRPPNCEGPLGGDFLTLLEACSITP